MLDLSTAWNKCGLWKIASFTRNTINTNCTTSYWYIVKQCCRKRMQWISVQLQQKRESCPNVSFCWTCSNCQVTSFPVHSHELVPPKVVFKLGHIRHHHCSSPMERCITGLSEIPYITVSYVLWRFFLCLASSFKFLKGSQFSSHCIRIADLKQYGAF